jgi:hypothetical protein
MGLGIHWHGGRPKNNPRGGYGGGGGGGQARGAGCYLLRWRWANNPLALPSKCAIPADLSITDPTYLIAERDGAPLGERHEALARRRWRAKEE